MKTENPTTDQLKETCVICLNDIEQNHQILNLRCKHFYHGDCIKTWLSEKMSCPTCRTLNIF